MKTHDVLTIDEKELSSLIGGMKIKELEKHAQKIIHKLGADDSADTCHNLLSRIIKVIPDEALSSSDKYQRIHDLLLEQLPAAEDQAYIYPRLTIIMTMIVVKKFHDLHGEMNSRTSVH